MCITTCPQVLESHLRPCMYSKDRGLKVNFAQNDYKTMTKIMGYEAAPRTLGCFGNRSSVFLKSDVLTENCRSAHSNFTSVIKKYCCEFKD